MEEIFDRKYRSGSFATVCAICGIGLPTKFVFRCECDKTLVRKQVHHGIDCERPSAKSKCKNLITGLVIASYKLVKIDDVTLQPPSNHSAKQGKRYELRCSNPVVIISTLLLLRS